MKWHGLLMCACWSVLSFPLMGVDVLDCPFAPRDKTAADEEYLSTLPAWYRERNMPEPPVLTRQQIRKLVVNAFNWKCIHPTIKSWIDKNQDRYFQVGKDSAVLYTDANYGIRIMLARYHDGSRIYLHRMRWFDDDAAWEYKKEAALNPVTKKPWIELSREERKKIQASTNAKLSPEEELYVKDVLNIVNENIHYYYGMRVVNFRGNRKIDREKLIGKFIPPKHLCFGKRLELLDLSGYTEQQKDIYKALGHPIYSYKGMINSESESFGSSYCKSTGIDHMPLKDGTRMQLPFYHYVSTDEYEEVPDDPVFQVYTLLSYYPKMMKRMEQMLQEKGCDLHCSAANKTPLAQALEIIYRKTKYMVDAIVSHPWVEAQYADFFFEEGITSVCDAVKIPGIKRHLRNTNLERLLNKKASALKNRFKLSIRMIAGWRLKIERKSASSEWASLVHHSSLPGTCSWYF